MKEKFDGKNNLFVMEYANNSRLCIVLIDDKDNLVDNITANLSDAPITQHNQIFLNGELSKHIKNKLIAKGIISKPKKIQKYNLGKYEVAYVNFEMLRNYDSKGVDDFLNKHIDKTNNLFEEYSKEEIKKLLENNTKLVYVDDGATEIVVKYEDLPDVIVDINDKFGLTNLEIFDYQNPSLEPIATTSGHFLDKCDPKVRTDIIDRLVELQTNQEEVKDYKIINPDILEEIEHEKFNNQYELEK